MNDHSAKRQQDNVETVDWAERVGSLADLVFAEVMLIPNDQRLKAVSQLVEQIIGGILNAGSTPNPAATLSGPIRVTDASAASGTASPVDGPATAGHGEGSSTSKTWVLKRVEQVLVSPQGEKVRLSGREFILLEMLTQSEGRQVSRQIVSKLFGYDNLSPSTRSLDSVIYRLRHKARAASLIIPLTTIHAAGIRFTEPLEVV